MTRNHAIAALAASLLACNASAPARAAVTLLDKDWKISLGGFIETDLFNDSTRSFTEVIGNSPVERSGSSNGEVGRTQLSIRNSRLSFNIEAPKMGDMKTRAYFEFDLLGFDPSPGASNSEGAFFNNPTFRVRHAYVQNDGNGWAALLGQTWSLLGWQPYYFISTVDVSPLPGMLYGRTAQIRGIKTVEMGESTLQVALAVMRPPQRDSQYPALEGGIRLAFNGRKAGFTGGSTGGRNAMLPLSLGISGALREFSVPKVGGTPSQVTHYPGSALAVDASLPVLAASDDKDAGSTLSLLGEFTTGTGYGDEFSGWSGNLASQPSTTGLDAGLGDYNAAGTFQLVKLRTFNVHAQYHLPSETATWIDTGYGQLYSNNVGTLAGSDGKTSAGKAPYERDSVAFANVFHDLDNSLRLGFEYDHVRTSYSDGVIAHDNRYQLSAYYLF